MNCVSIFVCDIVKFRVSAKLQIRNSVEPCGNAKMSRNILVMDSPDFQYNSKPFLTARRTTPELSSGSEVLAGQLLCPHAGKCQQYSISTTIEFFV